MTDGKVFTATVARIGATTGATFEAPASLTLLEAALLEGVPLASSCRNGTCRACMCKLREGRVRYRIEWPGLSLDEKDEGFILPCVAMPESDVVIEPAAP